jgi:Mn-dependent DtxR family transcriptional regulator
MVSSVIKQYLKHMYLLADPTDQVAPSQLAKALGVNPSAVSRMTRKLANHGWVKYEPYGKMYLTKKGKQFGKTLVKHHEVLEQFLKIIGEKDDYLIKELDEIEFNVSPKLIKRIEMLNQYFSQDISRIKSFNQFCN